MYRKKVFQEMLFAYSPLMPNPPYEKTSKTYLNLGKIPYLTLIFSSKELCRRQEDRTRPAFSLAWLEAAWYLQYMKVDWTVYRQRSQERCRRSCRVILILKPKSWTYNLRFLGMNSQTGGFCTIGKGYGFLAVFLLSPTQEGGGGGNTVL